MSKSVRKAVTAAAEQSGLGADTVFGTVRLISRDAARIQCADASQSRPTSGWYAYFARTNTGSRYAAAGWFFTGQTEPA